MMKYVMYRQKGTKVLVPAVFDEFIMHSSLLSTKLHKPVSAGHVKKNEAGSWVAYGGSSSLGLEHKEEDSLILNLFLNEGLSGIDLQDYLKERTSPTKKGRGP